MLPNDLGHFLHLASQQKSNFQSEHKPFTPKVCHMFHASKKRFSSSGKEASILAKWTLNLGAQGFNPMADPIIYDLCGRSLVTLAPCNTASIAGHNGYDAFTSTSFFAQPVNSEAFSRLMKISSTPGWVSQLHVLIHIVRILFEAIIRSLKQSQGQWVCCTRKSISTSWKLPFQKFNWRLFKVDAWISELSSAFLDIANSGIYLTKAMGPRLAQALPKLHLHITLPSLIRCNCSHIWVERTVPTNRSSSWAKALVSFSYHLLSYLKFQETQTHESTRISEN